MRSTAVCPGTPRSFAGVDSKRRGAVVWIAALTASATCAVRAAYDTRRAGSPHQAIRVRGLFDTYHTLSRHAAIGLAFLLSNSQRVSISQINMIHTYRSRQVREGSWLRTTAVSPLVFSRYADYEPRRGGCCRCCCCRCCWEEKDTIAARGSPNCQLNCRLGPVYCQPDREYKLLL